MFAVLMELVAEPYQKRQEKAQERRAGNPISELILAWTLMLSLGVVQGDSNQAQRGPWEAGL